MANISIGGRISLLQRVASLDLRYGPYSSIADAYDNMGPSGDDVITAGLPFGVTEDDGSVSVYIWTKCEDATQTDCRKLDKEHIVLFNGFIDISVSIKQQSYNDVATKDNIVFLNDRKQFAYRDGLNFYINWKNRYVWSNENLIPYDDVIYIDINDNKAYYYNGTTLTLLASETFVSSINNQAPDENGNVNITKEHIGLEKVDNTSDTEKVVKGASEDGSGNNIAATYETKTDATTKQTALQGAINALQTSVAALTGLDSTNFGGFSIQSTEADAISNIATLYTADGYTDELLWYMAGTSLSSVKAYRYNGSGTPTAISSDSYDCVDFSGLIADVSTLSQNLAALGPKCNEAYADVLKLRAAYGKQVVMEYEEVLLRMNASTQRIDPQSTTYTAAYEVKAGRTYHIAITMTWANATIGAVGFVAGNIPTSGTSCEVIKEFENTDYSVDYTPEDDGHLFVTYALGSLTTTNPYEVTESGYENFDAKFAEVDEEIDRIDDEIEELNDKANADKDAGTFYKNGYVNYSTGAIVNSSGGAKLYIILPSDIPERATKIFAHICTQSTTFAAISFFSEETPTQESYMASASVQGIVSNDPSDFEATIPEGWKSCLVLNMSQLFQDFKILLDTPIYTDSNDLNKLGAAMDTKIAEINERDISYRAAGSLLQGGFINFQTGKISSSSGGALLYIIRRSEIPAAASKVFAYVNGQSTTFAAVAFYSVETPTGANSEASYIPSASVAVAENAAHLYEVSFPQSWESCVILNMSQLFSGDKIYLDVLNSLGVSSIKAVEEEFNEKLSLSRSMFNMFDGFPFYHHLHQEQNSTQQTVPAQSLLDVTYAKRLGANLIEASIHACSDGVYVVKHGNAGKLGAGIKALDGEDYSSTLFSSVTSTWLRENITYDCNRPKYNVAIPTWTEFLAKCKQEGVGVKFSYVDAEPLAMARQYLPDEKIFITASSRPTGFRGTIEYVFDPDNSTVANCMSACKTIGAPLQIVILAGKVQTTADSVVSELVNAAHINGFTVGLVYTNLADTIKYMGMGVDAICSSFKQINLFEEGNTFNVRNLTDSHIHLSSGASYDSTSDTISLPVGGTMYISGDPFTLGKVCVHLRFKGKINAYHGWNYSYSNLDHFESDGNEMVSYALALTPNGSSDNTTWISITAVNMTTTIYEIKLAASIL